MSNATPTRSMPPPAAIGARVLTSRKQAMLGLALSTLWLLFWNLLLRDDARLLQAFADLRFSGVNLGSLAQVAMSVVRATVPYAVMGAMAMASVVADRRPGATFGQRMQRRLTSMTRGGLLGGVIAWIAAGLQPGGHSWHAPGVVELALPLLGTAFGLCIGDLLRMSPRAALRGLVLRLLVLSVLMMAVALWLRALLLAALPLDLPPAHISSQEKRALVELARSHNPFRVPPGQTTELRLSPSDLHALLAWGTTVFDAQSGARVTPTDDGMRLQASMRVGSRYLNVDMALAGRMPGAGALELEHCQLRVGALDLGSLGCSLLVRGVHSAVTHQRALVSALAPLRELVIDRRGMTARYGGIALDSVAKGTLRQLLAPSLAVREGVDSQVAMLRTRAPALVASDDPFAAVVQASFGLARSRAAKTSPVVENQAAILALAGLLGHRDIFTIGGLDRPADQQAIFDAYAKVALYGRDDWRRHFLVSAALTQVSNTLMSDAVGLLKEELDAGGGSGFSFADLQMDRAGTLFGETAMRTQASARALQALLLDAYRVEDIAPPAHDMPEGFDDASLRAQFGGVGGPGYRALVAKIEARVRGARAYRRAAPERAGRRAGAHADAGAGADADAGDAAADGDGDAYVGADFSPR